MIVLGVYLTALFAITDTADGAFDGCVDKLRTHHAHVLVHQRGGQCRATKQRRHLLCNTRQQY